MSQLLITTAALVGPAARRFAASFRQWRTHHGSPSRPRAVSSAIANRHAATARGLADRLVDARKTPRPTYLAIRLYTSWPMRGALLDLVLADDTNRCTVDLPAPTLACIAGPTLQRTRRRARALSANKRLDPEARAFIHAVLDVLAPAPKASTPTLFLCLDPLDVSPTDQEVETAPLPL